MPHCDPDELTLLALAHASRGLDAVAASDELAPLDDQALFDDPTPSADQAAGGAPRGAEVLAHLRSCASCRAELAALTTTVRLAREGGVAPDAPLEPPPPRVWAAVQAALDLGGPPGAVPAPRSAPSAGSVAGARPEPRPDHRTPSGPARRSPCLRRRLPTAAAVLALVLGVGVVVGPRLAGGPEVVNRAVLAEVDSGPTAGASGTAEPPPGRAAAQGGGRAGAGPRGRCGRRSPAGRRPGGRQPGRAG
ncbi:MAG: hypothetical protein H7233_06215, partial [Pseudorhodobacter sp.]|nr:hypothetical protein [Frankiaceae bacterium]